MSDRAPVGPGAATPEEPAFTIRRFETVEDFRACVELQEATWGDGFSERVPSAILRVGQILGGVSAGAYDADGRLVGFVFGLTGVRDGALAHWSDMLAVRPELRDTGLGRRLKEYQRARVLELGVERMFWTFDPLQSRNAHLNITRLGVVVREYRENMYGESDSPLHRGIGTDRFVALWLMDSERVGTRLAGTDDREWVHAMDAAPYALRLEVRDGLPRPVPEIDPPGNEQVRIAIPLDVNRVMHEDAALAVQWRNVTRPLFQHYLSQGYEVREFRRGAHESTYLVARRDEESE